MNWKTYTTHLKKLLNLKSMNKNETQFNKIEGGFKFYQEK